MAESQFDAVQQRLIAQCSGVFGTGRFKQLVAEAGLPFYPVTPIAQAFTKIREALAGGNVALLASGDPLYYGIGNRLLKEFPAAAVEFFPALSAIQRAAALCKLPWDDARVVSLHGRTATHLPTMLLRPGKTLVFTDPQNSPSAICSALLGYLQLIGETQLLQQITVMVAADIGLTSQNFFRGSLTECSKTSFSALTIFCLLLPPAVSKPDSFRLGLSEDDIHHSRGLITKNEVRAATLHHLALPPKGIFWDIGAGSGSISIEAARANPDLTVYAVERQQQEIDNIKKNIVKFGCYNVVPVCGEAPGVLADLATPDRIFVGGSGGKLSEIAGLATKRLSAGGRLVVNGVIAKTIEATPQVMAENNLSCSSSTISVSRRSQTGEITTYNPITIFTGRKLTPKNKPEHDQRH
jgi:precorrin-6Y C5,15-methyltransferase (decarboxylating)